MSDSKELFEEIRKLVSEVQAKCPVASVRTFDKQKKELLDEAIEVRMAVDKEDWENLKEELGDVLWDWLVFCWIAEQKGLFKTSEVLETLKAKIKRRNPHVFGNAIAKTKEEVEAMRQEIKKKEKQKRGKK
jgi:tetrapyrrole methylase family protein/MazG family protein